MSQHPNAKLAPRGRETLVSRIEPGLGVAEVARQMGVSRQTASKWLWRSRAGEPMLDRSSRPRRLAKITLPPRGGDRPRHGNGHTTLLSAQSLLKPQFPNTLAIRSMRQLRRGAQ